MLKLDWKKINKIYFSGIGGIGVSAMARYFKKSGYEVLGSDLSASEITDDLQAEGILVNLSQDKKNVDDSIGLLVYSSAVPANNPERQAAEKLGIPQYSYNQVLGDLSERKHTLAISGTNGKTTTTAMSALILEAGGIDPLAIVGSKVRQWNSNLRFSESDYFLVEACEHQAHMLELSPKTIVLTNIAADHLDFYGDLDNIIDHFQKYIDKLPDDGVLIYNYDDANIAKLKWQKRNFKIMTFSFDNPDADVFVDKYQVKAGQQDFWVVYQGEDLVRIHLHVPGKFNVYNALAAITLALSLGVSNEAIKSALESFAGTWRRFENLGEKDGVLYISDYGHHPDAIRGTIQAAREFYPDRRIVLVFQPHHHNRTRMLFDDFVTSIAGADVAIVSEIYKVAGRMDEKDLAVSSKDLVKEISKINSNVSYTSDLDEAFSLLQDVVRSGDVVLLMGAGDIVKLNKRVLE